MTHPFGIKQAWRRFPLTLALTVTCVGLYAATLVVAETQELSFGDAQRKLGVSCMLVFVALPELYGLLDVWKGEWWRIPLSALHHAHILHLVMNGLGIWILGALLEPRLGWKRYLVLIVMSACFSMLPEGLLEHQAVGISGVVCAMLGALLVLRSTDGELQDRLTPGFIRFALGWIFLCIPLTALGYLQVANVAHFMGLLYGAVFGMVIVYGAGGPWARRSFYALHLVLIPGFVMVQQPVWIGRYHWKLAADASSPEAEQRHLKEALRIDPGLGPAWIMLAKSHLSTRDVDAAWEAILQGIYWNRSNQEAIEFARELWAIQVARGRAQGAMEVVHDTFGDESATWSEKVARIPRREKAEPEESVLDKWISSLMPTTKARAATPRPLLYEYLQLPRLIPLNPDSADSAAEGVRL